MADQEAVITVDNAGALRNVHSKQLPRVWVKGLVKMDVK